MHIKKLNEKLNLILNEEEITFGRWKLDKEDGYLYLDIYCPENIYDPTPILVVGVPQDNNTISYYIVDEYNDTFFGKIDFPKPDQSLVDECLKSHKKYDERIDITGREDWPDTHPGKYIDLGKVEKYKEVSNFDTMLKRDGYEVIGKVETGKFYYKRFKVIMNNVKLEVKCFPEFYDSQQFIHFSTYPNQSYWFNYAKLERESIPKYLKRIEQKMLEFSEKIYNRRNNLRNKRINKEI